MMQAIRGLTAVKLLLKILLDSAKLLDCCTDVRAVNDVNLDSFANSRELSAAFVVFLGEEVTHLISLYGTHESFGRDLIPKLSASRIMLSDGGKGDTALLTLGLWYNPHEFGCHLGKFGSKRPTKREYASWFGSFVHLAFCSSSFRLALLHFPT